MYNYVCTYACNTGLLIAQLYHYIIKSNMLLQNRDRTSPRNSLNHERSGKRLQGMNQFKFGPCGRRHNVTLLPAETHFSQRDPEKEEKWKKNTLFLICKKIYLHIFAIGNIHVSGSIVTCIKLSYQITSLDKTSNRLPFIVWSILKKSRICMLMLMQDEDGYKTESLT